MEVCQEDEFEEARHEVLSRYIRPEEERSFTVAFNLAERQDMVKLMLTRW